MSTQAKRIAHLPRHLKDRASLVYLLALVSLITYTFPILVRIENPHDFHRHKLSEILLVALFCFVLLSGISVGVALAFGLWKKHYFERATLALLFLVAFFGLVFPVSQGWLDGHDLLHHNYLSLFLGLTIAAWIVKSGHDKIVFPMLLFVALYTVYYTAAVASLFPEKHQKAGSGFYELSSTRNTILITIDSLQSNDVLAVFETSPELKSEFAGFTFFTHTTGFAPWTKLAVLTLKAGEVPDEGKLEEFTEKNRPNFITTKLKDNGIETHTYGSYADEEPTTEKSVTRHGLLYFGGGDGYAKAFKASLYRYLPVALAGVASHAAARCFAAMATLSTFRTYFVNSLPNQGMGYRDWKYDIHEFNHYRENLYVGEETPKAHFLHFVFPHYPYRYSADCVLRPRNNPTYEGAMSETRCALKKLQQLVQKLKTLGVYEKSFIILGSDHGQECSGQKSSSHTSYKVSPRWCLSRFMPFMMLKPPGAKGEIKENPFEASLLDVAKTICRQHFQEGACTAYSGVNLLKIEQEDNLATRKMVYPKKDAGNEANEFNNYQILDIGRQMPIQKFFGQRSEKAIEDTRE